MKTDNNTSDNRFDVTFFLRLRLVFGAASTRAYNVYNKLKSGQVAEEKDKERIEAVKDEQISDVIKACKENNIRIITIQDDGYPDILRNISLPPLVLFVRGVMPDFECLPTVTIVGPRKVSDFGKRAAYSLALRLSKAGFTVVSGAAHGADSLALKGAIEGGGIPVGVLGCGLLFDYLPENRAMRNKIIEKGCLISEYTPYEGATKYSFPARNRIMAALSSATVVVEAGAKSGALITAKHAVEQGRDVFVIPGNPTLLQYKGSNALLRDGAIPLLDASDVFNLYLPSFPDKINVERAFSSENEKSNKKFTNKSVSGLSKNAALLYNTINKKVFIIDDMLITGLSGDIILSSLTELELMGFIKSLPGGAFEVL